MITLKESQQNTIAYQKETDTPLVTSSYDNDYVFNIVLYPTLQNDTGSASITFTTSSSEENPRWETLSFDISSSTNYVGNVVQAYPGTTYNLEVWYGPLVSGSALVWGTATDTWIGTDEVWSTAQSDIIGYNEVKQSGTLRFSDRVFVSGSVSPLEKKYISSNENAVYTVYQG